MAKKIVILRKNLKITFKTKLISSLPTSKYHQLTCSIVDPIFPLTVESKETRPSSTGRELPVAKNYLEADLYINICLSPRCFLCSNSIYRPSALKTQQ